VIKRAALVLSGGKAERFQRVPQGWQDKALALFEGKPLLVYVIENVADVVDEVIVCVDNNERRERYFEVLEHYNLRVKIVVDKETNVGGPNAAILTGLKATEANYCMITPCDMPFLKPTVVDYLFSLSERGFEVVMPMWPNGVLETLIMILQRSIGLEIIQTLCQLGRPHPSDIPRAATNALLASPMETIKNLDPTLKSFININTQEDLKKPKTRNLQGTIQQNITLNHGNFLASYLQLVRDADKMQQKNNFHTAQEQFDLCKKHFKACGNFFWTAMASKCKGEVLLKQLQQKETSPQTTMEWAIKYEEALFDATNNYYNEIKIYKKNHCRRLLERATADKNLIHTLKINASKPNHDYLNC